MIFLKNILGVTQPNRSVAAKLLKLPIAADNTASVGSRDNIVEFAARVCYASEANLGTSPTFIGDCVRRGHDDIIEHFWLAAEFQLGFHTDIYRIMYMIQSNFPWSRMRFDTVAGGEKSLTISANGRVWRQMIPFLENTLGIKTASLLRFCAPQSLGISNFVTGAYIDYLPLGFTIESESQMSLTGQNVTLLGAMPTVGMTNFSAATFLIENMSRAAANQFTRHRTLSFSQESQRYVDIEKSAGGVLVPESISSHDLLCNDFLEHWNATQKLYRKFRDAGIRKEDARALLPQSFATRFVVSGSQEGWSNFFKLRLHKSAQAEIRCTAEVMYDMIKSYMNVDLD